MVKLHDTVRIARGDDGFENVHLGGNSGAGGGPDAFEAELLFAHEGGGVGAARDDFRAALAA